MSSIVMECGWPSPSYLLLNMPKKMITRLYKHFNELDNKSLFSENSTDKCYVSSVGHKYSNFFAHQS